jgi:hypothetical protein
MVAMFVLKVRGSYHSAKPHPQKSKLIVNCMLKLRGSEHDGRAGLILFQKLFGAFWDLADFSTYSYIQIDLIL